LRPAAGEAEASWHEQRRGEDYVPAPEELGVGERGRHRSVRIPRGGWVRLPAAVAGARWQPGRAAVLGVLLVTVLAVLVLGLRVAWARSGDQGSVVAPGGGARAGPTGVATAAVGVGVPAGAPVAGAAGASPAASPGPSATGQAAPAAAGSAGSAGSAGGEVVVHVVGQVRRPGVRHLPVGARVADAVAAAGGATPGADLAGLNLARVLVDGEQVRVPKPGEGVAAPSGPGGGGSGPAGSPAGRGPVALNTADLAALDTLPGVGPVLAQRIVDWRTAHGRFTSVDELAEVSGIGEKLLAQLRPLVTT
jgi:competence protein ComEA